MKKMILLFFLLSLLTFNSESVNTVSYTDNSSIACIKFTNLTSKNMFLKLRDFKIYKIVPYVNPIYKRKLNSLSKYYFNNYISQNDIQKFINYYLNELKNNGYYNDYYNYYIHGIPIERVYIEKNELLDIKKNIIC